MQKEKLHQTDFFGALLNSFSINIEDDIFR